MSIEGCLGHSSNILGLGANDGLRPFGLSKLYDFVSTGHYGALKGEFVSNNNGAATISRTLAENTTCMCGQLAEALSSRIMTNLAVLLTSARSENITL
jgi:hypothetical protein